MAIVFVRCLFDVTIVNILLAMTSVGDGLAR